MLDPKTIQSKTFTKSMFGYSQTEVDEHIAYLTEVYGIAYNRTVSLETDLKIKSAALEDYQRNDAKIRRAREEADTIVASARAQSEAILGSTKEACNRIFVDLRKKVKAEKEALENLSKIAEQFKRNIYAAYETQIDLIGQNYPTLDPLEYSYDDGNFIEDVLEQIKLEQRPLKHSSSSSQSASKPVSVSPEATLDPSRIKARPASASEETRTFDRGSVVVSPLGSSNKSSVSQPVSKSADPSETMVWGGPPQKKSDDSKEYTGTFDFSDTVSPEQTVVFNKKK